MPSSDFDAAFSFLCAFPAEPASCLSLSDIRISRSVTDKIFCSISAIGISSVSDSFTNTLASSKSSPSAIILPHLGQNFVPSRKAAPHSGQLFFISTLEPHCTQNLSVSSRLAPHFLHFMVCHLICFHYE